MFPLPQFSSTDRSRLFAAFPRIETIFRQFAEQHPVPGLAYGIVVDGKLATAGGIGVQNVVDQTAVTPDSIFRIASMSKSFTAMAVMKLRDDGKLRLDNPVKDYVPELADLPYPTRDSAPITVRQLLTMSGGFPQDDPWADRQLALPEGQFSTLMKNGISFSNPPGIKFEYSNYGYAILGRVVTNASGMPHQTFIKQNILDPLGMTSSTFDIKAVSPERLAIGYRREQNEWIEEPPLADGAFASMGGLFTTITDFAHYMAFLLSAFPARDDDESGPVRRSSVREMQQPWQHRIVASIRPSPDLPALVQSDGYGYGLVAGIDSVLGYSVAHGGGLPGYGTFYRLLPDCNVGIVAFTNLTYSPVALKLNEAYAALHKTGGLQVRSLPNATVLLDMQKAITGIYDQWDDDRIKAISTDSFFLDLAIEKRKQQFEQLRKDFGAPVSNSAFTAENALRGRWTMQCKKGRIEVFITLAPTIPPQLQFIVLTGIKPLNPTLKKAATQLVSLINSWDKDAIRGLLAQKVKPAQIERQFKALQVQYGSVRLGDVLESDGKTLVRVRLIGKQGSVDMKVQLDPKSGRVSEVTFTRPRETNFVP
jgi:CubicO group peptidase (beta-lactamase class C family)